MRRRILSRGSLLQKTLSYIQLILFPLNSISLPLSLSLCLFHLFIRLFFHKYFLLHLFVFHVGPIDHTLPPICASLCRYLSYLFHSLSVGGLSYKRSHLLSLYPLCILSFSLSLIPFSICVHLDLLIYQLSTNNASKCYLSYSPFLFHSLSRSLSLSLLSRCIVS